MAKILRQTLAQRANGAMRNRTGIHNRYGLMGSSKNQEHLGIQENAGMRL